MTGPGVASFESIGSDRNPPFSVAPDPHALFGDLFETVQMRQIYPDGKTFPDMEPIFAPSDILKAWRLERPATNAEIAAFLSRHFVPPVETSMPRSAGAQPLNDYIGAVWDELTRPASEPAPNSSALPLPCPYIVPGGRFREIYYWDSYFTILGLQADGRDALVENMLDNFVSLVERYGHVPNGTRSYFLTRSQPPFLAPMMALSKNGAVDVRRRRLQALKLEHAYWMAGAAEARSSGAAEHVVVMPDGALLNRYWDAADTPRPESYAEDVATARQSTRPAAQVYRDLRAGAETGWDFSSRWLSDSRTLASIQTTAIVPVDLNSLLYLAERNIAVECERLGQQEDAAVYQAAAERRARAIRTYLWSPDCDAFVDWRWVDGSRSAHITAATLYPLFAGLATSQQARAIAARVRTELLGAGGLRTTTLTSDQQWDAPNGWAPLQWIAVQGLRDYGETALAETISRRWLSTVEAGFAATGFILEKYNVEGARPAEGGEYPTQLGFGWTNGVTRALSTMPRDGVGEGS